MEQKAGEQKREDFIIILLGLVLSYIDYLFIMVQISLPLSDYGVHIYSILSLFTKDTWLQGWKAAPYCIWHLCVMFLNHILHIPLEASAAYVGSFFYLISYFILYWMIRRYLAARKISISASAAGLIAFGLSIAQSLYFYWLDTGDRYLGTFSMTPLHSPTQASVRPFVLLCFCMVCDIWGRQKDAGYQGVFFHVEKGLKKYYVYLAVLLFLSSLAKPVFAEMFIPSVALVMLIEWLGRIKQKNGSARPYFVHCLTTLLCAVPTLLSILVQSLAFFVNTEPEAEQGGVIITKWMEVWNIYSENILLSIALGMAFPLFIVLIDSRFFMKEDMGRLAVAGYATGLIEAAVLGEGGNRMSHANFMWPMMCGMLLLWVAAMLRFLTLAKTQAGTKTRRLLTDFAWFLFVLHVICGVAFLYENIFLLS